MKVAFTEWNGRIAPVFDVAQTVLMVEMEMDGNTSERLVGMPSGLPSAKVAFLIGQKVNTLVCGAISRQVRELAEAKDIQVHPFVAGEIRDIVDAWRHGSLDQVQYSMPGCHRRQRSRRTNQ